MFVRTTVYVWALFRWLSSTTTTKTASCSNNLVLPHHLRRSGPTNTTTTNNRLWGRVPTREKWWKVARGIGKVKTNRSDAARKLIAKEGKQEGREEKKWKKVCASVCSGSSWEKQRLEKNKVLQKHREKENLLEKWEAERSLDHVKKENPELVSLLFIFLLTFILFHPPQRVVKQLRGKTPFIKLRISHSKN